MSFILRQYSWDYTGMNMRVENNIIRKKIVIIRKKNKRRKK